MYPILSFFGLGPIELIILMLLGLPVLIGIGAWLSLRNRHPPLVPCPHCGQLIQAFSVFCQHCGEQLGPGSS